MNIGSALKQARVGKGINQELAAELSKTSQTYLSKIETGKLIPSTKMVAKLCKAYEVPVAIVMFMSVRASDVPKSKRKIFGQLKPHIQNLIDSCGFLSPAK